MPPRGILLLVTWLLLLVLLGIEFAASLLHLAPWLRTLILLPALLMEALVVAVFMEIGRGPMIVRGFAVAGVVWLSVLLGLSSMDPMTRTDYHVTAASPR